LKQVLEMAKMAEVKARTEVIPAPELCEWGLIIIKAIAGVGH